MTDSNGQILIATCAHDAPCLNRTLTDTMARLLAKDAVIDQRWLCEGEAWELKFVAQADGGAHVKKQAKTATIGLPVDINIVPDEGPRRRKRLLLADMDSTIIQQECIDELADAVGLGDEVASITERAMQGELNFDESLRTRVALLKGLSSDVLEAVLGTRISLMPGARTLVETMKEHGAFCALVSGGFTIFAGRVAEVVGFDDHQANVLEIADGTLSGRVVEPILGQEGKRDALTRFAKELNIPLGDTLAVGDGANDLGMIAAAGLGVAFRAKPVVASAARVSLNHSDLRALLYLQGYGREEFSG
ncbi:MULTISPECIES: phosphoserine phosphatase SerB [Filomicrobium]|uniref:Phosphoserine phosphatase n=1 Tax=Filomicrobium insigne TaxID=418854 RepID=A0A1H0R0F1_9HYPH|nr:MULTISPECIES: phosphoserine phosphatase SerB [Filomicrobium]SDP22947.1 phosphoserine phosphatase [Filomicrobium insigne]